MIYNRVTYSSGLLEKEDFVYGLGFNTELLRHFMKKKSDEYDFYHEDGMSIDGTIRKKKYHPLLNKVLIDLREDKNKREVVIESVHKHWYYGYYWCLVFRAVGTNSHGTLYFKNENSIDYSILEGIDNTHNNYKFKNKKLNWKNI